MKHAQNASAAPIAGQNAPVMIVPAIQDQTQDIIQKHARSAIDEQFAPTLAYEAFSIQTRESFEGWLRYYFPSVSACVESRVQVTWMGFFRTGWSTFPPALVWAVRALTVLLMGASQGNKQAILCARHMYSRGIRHLASLIQTDSALTDESLAAAILLGGYEVLDGSSDRSWIIHARGICQLMQARGPSAHEHGMGRTLLMCWRPYIVAGAFIHGVPCFLGEPEWTRKSMSTEIARAEDEQGMGSLIGQTADYAFNEIAKCPGYLATTKEIFVVKSPALAPKRKPLLGNLMKLKQTLVRLYRTLSATEPPASFVGVIPSRHATTLVQASRGCIDSAIALLDRLLATLQSDPGLSAKFQSLGSTVHNFTVDNDQVWHLSAKKSRLEIRPSQQAGRFRDSDDPNPRKYAIEDQLDRFSLTMGMGSLLPNVCGIPQLSADDAIPGQSTTSPSTQGLN